MNVSNIPTFSSKEDAVCWMDEQVDDPYMDNFRFSFNDDQKGVEKYEMQRQDGCCGSFDTVVMVDGREATIGCNYGH